MRQQWKNRDTGQSDEIHAIADKNLTITSVNGKVEINAKEAILLKCGGSYLRIGPLGIESGTLGDIQWKADKFSLLGPASLPQVLPVLPTTRGNTDDDFIVSR